MKRVADGGDEGPTEPVWVCTECGRRHQKHSPPCSRCGNVELERRRPDYSDLEDEIAGTSYRDVLEPRYAAGFVLVALLGGVFLLGVTGVVDVPGFGPPSVADPPGNADHLGSLSLANVEDAYVEQVNARRERAGRSTVRVDDGLDSLATYYNRRTVQAVSGDGSMPSLSRDLVDQFSTGCDGSIYVTPVRLPSGAVSGDEGPSAVARRLIDASGAVQSRSGDGQFHLIGVDVHATPDGGLVATRMVC